MSTIKISDSNPFFFEKQIIEEPKLDSKDYLTRINKLIARMSEDNIDYTIIYGDREHFANIEYFSSYDCRFEESLLIIAKNGEKSIIVGNEGLGYSFQIPYEINRYLYQHFSLQGQPRNSSKNLEFILNQIGLKNGLNIGVCGYKYFLEEFFENPNQLFDLPEYIMQNIYNTVGKDNVINYTETLTGLNRGLRLELNSAKEVAWAEYQAVKCANVIINILKGLKENITEREAAKLGNIDFTPTTMFSLINFGPKNVSLGLRSGDDTKLDLGQVGSICYAIRGSLCSRSAIMSYDKESCTPELQKQIIPFYMEYWKALSTWFENVKINANTGEVYEKVMEIIGDKKFNVTLNPGHNTATDEWVNSPFYKNSKHIIHSGAYLQSDMIASSKEPVMSVICEDTVIVADEILRKEIKKEYPKLYLRLIRRQKKMRELLGINIDDSLLPLSNLTAVYFPFLLNTNLIFTKNNK